MQVPARVAVSPHVQLQCFGERWRVFPLIEKRVWKLHNRPRFLTALLSGVCGFG